MEKLWRGAGFVLVLALLMSLSTVSAQDDSAQTVAGSRIVIEDVLVPLIEASGAELPISTNINGSTAGLAALCSGEAAIVGATRALSTEEEQLCAENDVNFEEYLLGYDILTVVTNPDVAFADCLTSLDLATLFAPSATGTVTNWTNTGLEGAADLALTAYLPADSSATFSQLDDLVDGFGLRADAAIADGSVADAVASTTGAIGVVSFAEAAGRDDLKIMQLNVGSLGECTLPGAETVDTRQYSAASRLLLYVNTSAAEAIAPVLSFAFSEDGNTVVQNAGYTAPSAEATALNNAILAGEEGEGRQFSRDVVSFEIPANVIGAVNFFGSTESALYLADLEEQFEAIYPSVNIVLNLFGETIGAANFCAEDSIADILVTEGAIDEATLAACAEQEISLVTYPLGTIAVVMVGNAADTFNECLTTDQLITLWGSPSTETVTLWNQVSAEMPEQDLFTFAPPAGQNELSDLFLRPTQGPVLPLRSDITESRLDPLYRAAAVANASGTITYMSWSDYQDVLENGQENIRLIQIDNGSGCVAPSEETIADGSYGLTSSAVLNVKLLSLGRTEVQSVLWYIFSDENFSLIEGADFVGLTLLDLPNVRAELETLFVEAAAEFAAQAEAAAVEEAFDPLARPDVPAGEATPELDTESTPPVEG